jgi:hypothetical protein
MFLQSALLLSSVILLKADLKLLVEIQQISVASFSVLQSEIQGLINKFPD